MESHFVKIQEQPIHFVKKGSSDTAIILLHGWGLSHAYYLDLIKYLSDNGFTVYALDLPGFGKSAEPRLVWGFDNYTQVVIEFIKQMHIKQYYVIGHSFGGGVAVEIASKSPTGLLGIALFAPRCVIHKKTVKQIIKSAIAKTGKLIFTIPFLKPLEQKVRETLYSSIAASDYEKASPKMKQVMKQIIQTDLSALFAKIEVKTLIIWGKEDQSTPIEDAYQMKQKITHAQLFILENENHGFPYKNMDAYKNDLLQFLIHENNN